ncbi:MAG: universal stress protein [Bacteroidota bacterium]
MKYLIPFDFSPISKNAVNQALNFAEFTGGEISIIHVVHDKELFWQKEQNLKAYASSLKFEDNVVVSSHVVVGDALLDIGKLAEYHGIDLVIMGTHGVDSMQKIFGSNAVKIIKNSIVPFIVFQEHYEYKRIKKIVMPFSIDTKSMHVLKFAAKISKLYNAEIHLVGRSHTDEFYKHKENATVIMANKFLKEVDIKHHFEIIHVSKADFQDKVLDYASSIDADLIATTFYSDSILPVFEKFVQNLIVNKNHIPVLCVNSITLKKVESYFWNF